MEENKLKLQLTKFFTSSCITQNISQVIDHQNPIFTTSQNHLINNQNTISPSSSPYPSLPCKPSCNTSFDQMIIQNCTISRPKMAAKYTLLNTPPEFDDPHVSKQSKNKKKMKKSKQRVKKERKLAKPHLRNVAFSILSSSNETDGGDWFSSDDETEDNNNHHRVLFSSSKSISFSSDSDKYYPTRVRSTRVRRPRRKTNSGLGLDSGSGSGEVEVKGKVKDTFAVVKSSSDPYNDFRASMVEMIMEKQIFGANELENLLHCFLSLNSPHHHVVIVEAFTEIWDALFSYRC